MLRKAIREGDIRSVQNLLPYCGPDLIFPQKFTHRDPKQRTMTILHTAVATKREKIAELLIEKEPRLIPIVCGNNGETALHMAAKAGLVNAVRMMVAKDPQAVWMSCDSGETPLHWAVRAGQAEVAKVLLSHDMGLVAAVDKMGQNAFHLAAQYNRAKVLEVLIACCSSSSEKLSEATTATTTTVAGTTPLFLGADHKAIVKLLLAVNPRLACATDNFDNTVLHQAIRQRCLDPELIELLLKSYPEAANVRSNCDSRHPLDLALHLHGKSLLFQCHLDVVLALAARMCLDDIKASCSFLFFFMGTCAVSGESQGFLDFLYKVVRQPLLRSVVLPKELMNIVREYVASPSFLLKNSSAVKTQPWQWQSAAFSKFVVWGS